MLKKSEAAALVDAYNQRFGRGGPSHATSATTPTRSAGTPVRLTSPPPSPLPARPPPPPTTKGRSVLG